MKDTAENRLKEQIKQGLSATKTKPSRWPGLRLFSNPRGTAWHSSDNFKIPISYGLAPGNKDLASSDFIGWRTMTITPNMVGHKIAQFVSVEAKAPGKKAAEAQLNWLSLVQKSGGLIGLVQSVEQIDQMVESDDILMNIPVKPVP
jgi:hypothetical protein